MPPLWRSGLDESSQTRVIESRRLLPISPRAGVYLTLPFSNAARLSGRKGHRVLMPHADTICQCASIIVSTGRYSAT